MKIFFPIGSFYPSQQGGPCNSVFALTKALVVAGHEPKVLTTSFDISESLRIPVNQWTRVEGVSVFYLSGPDRGTPFMYDLWSLGHRSQIADILKTTTADIVHATMIFAMLPLQTAVYAKNQNLPVLWSPRGSMMPNAISRSALKKKLFMQIPWTKKGLTGCHFHATSIEEANGVQQVMRNYTGEDLEGRIHTIPNLATEQDMVSGGENPPYPFKYILYLGRIHPIKKIENLIEAMSQFSSDADLKLVVAGWTGEDATYSKFLKSRVSKLKQEDRVVFTDQRVEGIEKATLYKHAEIFVLPSESENFGMVVIESMAQGTPVIASKNTPWQSLEKSNAGYWVGNDCKSLSDAIGHFRLLSAPEITTMKKNAKQMALSYSGQALVSKYVGMYEAVLSGR